MDADDWGCLALALFFIVAMAALFIIGVMNPPPPSLPRCPEDSLIQGVGPYENGYFEYYICGPAVDDYR